MVATLAHKTTDMGVSPRDGGLLAPESGHSRRVTDSGDLRGVGAPRALVLVGAALPAAGVV